MSNSVRPYGLQSPGSSVHGISPGENTGVGCHFLLQGIFLTQGRTAVSEGGQQTLNFWPTWIFIPDKFLCKKVYRDIQKENLRFFSANIFHASAEHTGYSTSDHRLTFQVLNKSCSVCRFSTATKNLRGLHGQLRKRCKLTFQSI